MVAVKQESVISEEGLWCCRDYFPARRADGVARCPYLPCAPPALPSSASRGKQMEAVKPEIVVTLGSFPLRAYLLLRGRQTKPTLDAFVGKTESWNGSVVVFLPHTSGTSRWLNTPANKERFETAKAQLRFKLVERRIVQ